MGDARPKPTPLRKDVLHEPNSSDAGPSFQGLQQLYRNGVERRVSLGIKAHDLNEAFGRFATGAQLHGLHCDSSAGALSELTEFAGGQLHKNMPALSSIQGNQHVWMPASECAPNCQPLP